MIGLILVTSTVLFVLYLGVRYSGKVVKDPKSIFKRVTVGSLALILLGLIMTPASAFGAVEGVKEVNGNAMIGVALSTGLAALGAGIAVGLTGAAAIGAISEDPKMLGRSLIFVGLAEGVAIYGLVISILIFGRV